MLHVDKSAEHVKTEDVQYIVTDKMSIARQRLVKDHCQATLGKQCLKAGILKSIA
jgi:hypothetical protein